MLSAAAKPPLNPLPYHLRQLDVDQSVAAWLKPIDDMLILWGEWWKFYGDGSMGLGFKSMTPFERLNHATGSRGTGDIPPRPYMIEQLDNLVCQMPVEWVVVCGRWYISYGCRSEELCRKAVARDLKAEAGIESVAITRLRDWRKMVLGYMRGRWSEEMGSPEVVLAEYRIIGRPVELM